MKEGVGMNTEADFNVSRLTRRYCKSCGRHYIVSREDSCLVCNEKLIPYERHR